MDVSIPESPNPGWEFHWKPQEVFTSFFRWKRVWWSHCGRWFPYQIFWLQVYFSETSQQMPGIGFLQFFQCWWQHSKLSFTCRYLFFCFWQGCWPILAPGEGKFWQKQSTRVVWPICDGLSEKLFPRDASLFANNLPFCASTSCCFGSPAPLDICPHFLVTVFKMMDHRGCTFEGATQADHQTLLLEHHPLERKKSGRAALCTWQASSQMEGTLPSRTVSAVCFGRWWMKQHRSYDQKRHSRG